MLLRSLLSRFAGPLALVGARGVSTIAGLAAVLVAVRALDESSFGFWSALVSLTTLTSGLDVGIGNATRNRVAALRAIGDERGASEVFGAALIVVTLFSAGLAAIVIGGTAVAREAFDVGWSGPQYQALAVAILLLGAFQVGNLGQLALYAREQPVLVAVLEVARWAITIPALLLVAFADGGLVPMTAAYFLALTLSVLASVPLILAERGWQRRPPGIATAWRIVRRDLRLGAGFAALQFASTLVYQTDVLIAAQLVSLADTGDFALVQRLYLVPLSFLFAAIIPLWGRTSVAVARGNRAWARALAQRVAIGAAWAMALFGATAFVVGP